MARGFLLKDKDGRVGGYLQIQHQTLRCRLTQANEKESQDELILFSNDRQAMRLRLAFERAEQCFQNLSSEEQEISGAVVVRNGQVHLHTDECTARAYERSQKKQRSAESTHGRIENTRISEKTDTDGCHSQRVIPVQIKDEWPQRRWPPPACMPDAVYIQGRWTERSEIISAAD